MQVSCSLDSEVSEEELVCGVADVFGINISRTRNAKKEIMTTIAITTDTR